jgi:hypothetical protein
MSMRRLAKGWRKNWKFIVGMIVVAAIVGAAAALLLRGVEAEFRALSPFEKALTRPEQLTEQEKAQLKKIYKDLSPAAQEPAKQKGAAR